ISGTRSGAPPGRIRTPRTIRTASTNALKPGTQKAQNEPHKAQNDQPTLSCCSVVPFVVFFVTFVYSVGWECGDHFEDDQCSVWKSRDCECRSSGQGGDADAGKPFRVEDIDGLEIVDIGEHQCRPDDIRGRAAARIQNGLDVRERLQSLCLKTFLELAS